MSACVAINVISPSEYTLTILDYRRPALDRIVDKRLFNRGGDFRETVDKFVAEHGYFVIGAFVASDGISPTAHYALDREEVTA